MLPSREQLDGIVSALGKYISLVRAYHMEETAVLLNMARLDLQMKIHSISDSELQALCDVLESEYILPAADDSSDSSWRANVFCQRRPRTASVHTRLALPQPRPCHCRLRIQSTAFYWNLMPCKPAANGPAAQFAGHGRRHDRGIDDPWVRRRRIASVISFLPQRNAI